MRHQRGTSIVVALFVVVVVASLAAFAVTVGGAQQQSASTNLQANRALAAARSGLEWGAYRARKTGWCDMPPSPPPTPKTQVLNLTEGALKGFQVTVACTGHEHQLATYHDYYIEATATFGKFGSTEFASRTVSQRYFTVGF